nr:reverse transcriptase domain-containing protein [Tanacetum cinerariifolium]
MSDLQLVDQHNMVACLERTDGNTELHHIVDFLTSSMIHYALTPQKTHIPRQDKRGRDTEIPQSSGPPKKVVDEAVYTREDDKVVRVATIATNLEAEQESGNIHKTRSTATLTEPSPQGTGSDSGPRCQDTTLGMQMLKLGFETASKQSHDPPLLERNTSGSGEDSMVHHDDLTDFVPPTPYDSPLSGGHTPKSDEDRPNINEFMAICTQLLNMVLVLKQSKTAQDLVIKKLRKSLDKENVSKQGRNLKTRIEEGDTVNAAIGVSAASASVTTAGVSISTAEPRTPLEITTKVFEDEDLTIAQTHVKMRSKKAKEKGVVFSNVEESARPTTILPTIDPKDKGKYALLAARLQEKEREQFFIDEQARFLVETITERNSFTYNQLKNKSLKEIQKLYEREQNWINDFVHIDSKVVKYNRKKGDSNQKQAKGTKERPRVEHDEESVKKQKLEDDTKKEQLRACLDIVPRDDFAINVKSLATKYPIVDWKTHILTENITYYQIIRANRSFKNYKIFIEKCDDFDRQDVEEDEIWKAQQDYNLISWRLFDSCRVHVLLMDFGIAIHMMVERKYPLIHEMLSKMLNRKLKIDHERFFQIPITIEDQEKMTFTCPYETFTYRRMPLGFNIEIKDKKGVENFAVDHLSILESPNMESLIEREIADEFPDEHLMMLKAKLNDGEPWYAGYINYIIGKVVPTKWLAERRKRFYSQVKNYFWDKPYAF